MPKVTALPKTAAVVAKPIHKVGDILQLVVSTPPSYYMVVSEGTRQRDTSRPLVHDILKLSTGNTTTGQDISSNSWVKIDFPIQLENA